MTVVNLYGTEEEIEKLRRALNDVSLKATFMVSPSICLDELIGFKNAPLNARENSNADRATTISRLRQVGATVQEMNYRRGGQTVPELAARILSPMS